MSLPMPEYQILPPGPTTPQLEVVSLPIPTIRPAQDSDWRDRGACLGSDPEKFFPEKGSPSKEAKRTCNEKCTVREQCLEYALQNDERFGIWGGLSTLQRMKLLQERQGNPSKSTEHSASTAPGRRSRTAERDALIRKLRSEHVSPRDIAQKFDISLNTVYRVAGKAATGSNERTSSRTKPAKKRSA